MSTTTDVRLVRWLLGICSTLMVASILGIVSMRDRLITVETRQEYVITELKKIGKTLVRIDERLDRIEKRED